MGLIILRTGVETVKAVDLTCEDEDALGSFYLSFLKDES